MHAIDLAILSALPLDLFGGEGAVVQQIDFVECGGEALIGSVPPASADGSCAEVAGSVVVAAVDHVGVA